MFLKVSFAINFYLSYTFCCDFKDFSRHDNTRQERQFLIKTEERKMVLFARQKLRSFNKIPQRTVIEYC